MSSQLNAPQNAFPAASNGTPSLPEAYGVTRLVLMPRDPEWMHAYWEIAPYTWEEAEKTFGPSVRSGGRPVLRLFHAGNGKVAFDLDVHLGAKNWYIRLALGGGAWFAQLGLILADGRFVLLAISNTIHMPAGRVSDVLDEKWAVLKSEWDRLFELSGAGKLGAGSLDLARMLTQRWDLLKTLSSWSGTFLGGSSWSKPPAPPEKKFWLVADAEVVVYGATDPSATVKFQGKAIALNPDGTFSFRFALPDGKQGFPIEAVDRDGDLSESLEIVVTRKTTR
jgi:hypothetical protein